MIWRGIALLYSPVLFISIPADKHGWRLAAPARRCLDNKTPLAVSSFGRAGYYRRQRWLLMYILVLPVLFGCSDARILVPRFCWMLGDSDLSEGIGRFSITAALARFRAQGLHGRSRFNDDVQQLTQGLVWWTRHGKGDGQCVRLLIWWRFLLSVFERSFQWQGKTWGQRMHFSLADFVRAAGPGEMFTYGDNILSKKNSVL